MNDYSDCIDVNADRTQNTQNIKDGFSISISAPGKVILFGEHSVVYGKLALAASLGLRTKLTLNEEEPTEIGNNNVNINLNAVNLMHCYDLEDLEKNLLKKNAAVLKNISLEKPELANHQHLFEIIEEFIKKTSGSIPLSSVQHQALFSLFYLLIAMVGSANISLKPFNLTITSDMTISSGLGSSASYLVAISAALLEYIRFKTSKSKQNSTKVFSKKDLELISKWAYSAEKIIHGTPSGLDNTICTYGSIVEFRKNVTMKLIDTQYKLQILLVNSKIPKDTKAQVAKVAALKQNYPTVVDGILSSMENIAQLALQNFLKLEEISLSDKITLEECQKQIATIYGHILDLIDFNHNLLRSLHVSHRTLDEICAIFAENGLSGKLTGGGGGGYAFAIIPTAFNKTVLEKIIAKLNSSGFETVLTDLGGPGVLIT